MIEGNALKIENNVEVNNQNEFTGIKAKADFTPLIETTNNGLLYLGDKLGKPLVGAIECLFWAKIIEKCHTEPYFSMMCELKLLPFLKNDFAPKYFAIPEANRIPPNMRIAKAVFENVIDLEAHETTLKEMFANLLAGSMDNRKSDGIHPSYAKLISEFSEEDARFLMSLYERKEIPALRYHNDNIQNYKICRKTVDYGDQSSVMISRIESKQLLDTESRGFANSYDNHVFTNYFQETEELLKTELGNTRLSTQRLCLRLTELGQHFMQAVTLQESPTDEKS
jgi:hypothetical protein